MRMGGSRAQARGSPPCQVERMGSVKDRWQRDSQSGSFWQERLWPRSQDRQEGLM